MPTAIQGSLDVSPNVCVQNHFLWQGVEATSKLVVRKLHAMWEPCTLHISRMPLAVWVPTHEEFGARDACRYVGNGTPAAVMECLVFVVEGHVRVLYADQERLNIHVLGLTLLLLAVPAYNIRSFRFVASIWYIDAPFPRLIRTS